MFPSYAGKPDMHPCSLKQAGSAGGHLHHDDLMVTVQAQAELGGEHIAIVVLGGIGGPCGEARVGGHIPVLTRREAPRLLRVVHALDNLGAYEGCLGTDVEQSGNAQ